jgi:hypothetical protein
MAPNSFRTAQKRLREPIENRQNTSCNKHQARITESWYSFSMLPKSDYLELLACQPEFTFFYHDRPVLYAIIHNGEEYLVALAEEDYENKTERFLLVHYTESTFNLVQLGRITPREFFVHPDNIVHHVLIEYSESGESILALGEPYGDNTTIPDGYLPTVDAVW